MLKFHLHKYFLHHDYNGKHYPNGTDIALAIMKIDRTDHYFDEEELDKVHIPHLDFIRNEDIGNLRGSNIKNAGYPIEIFDSESECLVTNDNYLYEDEGPIDDIVQNQDNGAPIILFDS